jgi:hypothetical protein
MKLLALSTVCAALLVAGCSKPKEASKPAPDLPPVATRQDGSPTPMPGTDAPPAPPAPGKGDEATKPGDPAGPAHPGLRTPPPPDPKVFNIPKTGTATWTKTDMNPQELAAQIGKQMSSMKGVHGKIVVTITTPAEHGRAEGEVRVKDGAAYDIDFPVVKKTVDGGKIKADGKTRLIRSSAEGQADRKPVSAPTPDAKLTPAELARQWPKRFPRLVFLGVTDGKDPWKPLVEELVSGRSGFQTEVGERVTPFRGQMVKNYRIVAKRTPEAAKKLGPCEMEMIFDAKYQMPVSIRVNLTDPKEGQYKILWQAGWNFGHKFKPGAFQL